MSEWRRVSCKEIVSVGAEKTGGDEAPEGEGKERERENKAKEWGKADRFDVK